MSASILDGKALSKEIQTEIAEETVALIRASSVVPCLAAVLVGDDPASASYVKAKQRACERCGIESRLHRLSSDTTQAELLDLLAELNADDEVHGILTQLPLPKAIDELAVLSAIDPHKDVDGFHPENVGLAFQGRPRFLPCTPRGVMEMLRRAGVETVGKRAVVVGRSDIVGKPMAMLLAQRGADATVTLCHSRTPDLGAVCREADILVVAIGRAHAITADMVRPGATVIDVGVNRTEAGLVGDVDFEGVKQIADRITPVPGGVGPLTVTMVLRNTLDAAVAFAERTGRLSATRAASV